ncbi:MAG: hypothetical protein CMK59_08405 [Proteobacteria bacterium]|nr:hypothetical protein [Pseudomonadota bacterium]
MFHQKQSCEKAQEWLKDLKKIPSGKSNRTIGVQKEDVRHSGKEKSVAKIRALGKHGAAICAINRNISQNEILNCLEQWMKKAPSIEHQRAAVESFIQCNFFNTTSAQEWILPHIPSTIQDKRERGQLIEFINTLPFSTSLEQEDDESLTYLYWIYLLGNYKEQLAIQNLLRRLPLQYPYFRLFRWLYALSEQWNLTELYTCLTIRLFNENNNEDLHSRLCWSDNVNKGFYGGTAVALRRRTNRWLDKISENQRSDVLLDLLHNFDSYSEYTPWPLIKLMSGKGFFHQKPSDQRLGAAERALLGATKL